jgi:putative tryptophan/tyrosine transport system substrate-binding protein
MRGRVKRRNFIARLSSAVGVWPLAMRGQQTERMYRIRVLMAAAADDSEIQDRIGAFLQGLKQLGWIDGCNVQIEYRWGAGDDGGVRGYAQELVTLGPDVILAAGGQALALL